MTVLPLLYLSFIKIQLFLAAPGDPCTLKSQTFFFIPPWWEYIKDSNLDAIGKCAPNFNGPDGKFQLTDFLPIGLAVLDIGLRLAGFIAVIAIIYSGIRYIMSEGNPEKAAAARKWLWNSFIGLAIVFVATAIVTFVGNSLASK